jgi:nucleoid-associated protein YgaU
VSIFDFVKSVGKKLGIGGDDAPPTAEQIKADLDSYKLGTEKVSVEMKGDTAVIKGQVNDQSAFEKAVIAVGNTLGISKVEASEMQVAKAPDMAAAAPVFYTVKKGDNLWKIAERQYGKGKGPKHTMIFEANRPMLTHPDKIYPGQVLRIPPLA